jgi:hypothetical protein
MKNAATGTPLPVSQTDWKRARGMKDDAIAYDEDSPETTEADWAGAFVSHSHAEYRKNLAARQGTRPGQAARFPGRYGNLPTAGTFKSIFTVAAGAGFLLEEWP